MYIYIYILICVCVYIIQLFNIPFTHMFVYIVIFMVEYVGFFFNMAITEVLPMERWKKKKEKNFQGLKVITSVTIRGFFTGNIN